MRDFKSPSVRPFLLAASLMFLTLTSVAPPALGQEVTGWSDKAELSLVSTSGNAESTSFGFKNTLSRSWEKASFTLKVEGTRVESRGADFAVGTAEDFSVRKPPKETTAESYKADVRYDRKIGEMLFWYGGVTWDRNRFSGIDNRTSVQGGLGHVWVKREDVQFRTDYALTYTREEGTDGTENDFPGLRLSFKYLHLFGKSVTYESTLVVDENLDDNDDFRADMVNSLAVPLTGKLALKASLQLLYDHQPAFEQVPLLAPDLSPTGTTVAVELDELDTIFTTSLVVQF